MRQALRGLEPLQQAGAEPCLGRAGRGGEAYDINAMLRLRISNRSVQQNGLAVAARAEQHRAKAVRLALRKFAELLGQNP